MKKIQLFEKTFRTFITDEEVESILDTLAAGLNADYGKSSYEATELSDVPIALCVLNGAMIFACDILKRTEFPAEMASIRVSSYDGLSSTGKIKLDLPPTSCVKGRKVIIFEDIVETGTTVKYLIDYLKEQGAAEVRTCILFVKPGIFKNQYKLDYVGKEIPDAFIVGRGFDYNGLGRNTKDIYILDEQ